MHLESPVVRRSVAGRHVFQNAQLYRCVRNPVQRSNRCHAIRVGAEDCMKPATPMARASFSLFGEAHGLPAHTSLAPSAC